MGNTTSKATTKRTREFTLVLRIGVRINGVIILVRRRGRWWSSLGGSIVVAENRFGRAEVGGCGRGNAVAKDGVE